jgi:hypothetical protein
MTGAELMEVRAEPRQLLGDAPQLAATAHSPYCDQHQLQLHSHLRSIRMHTLSNQPPDTHAPAYRNSRLHAEERAHAPGSCMPKPTHARVCVAVAPWQVIGAYKDAGLPPTVWAAAVPNNYSRIVGDLMAEVQADNAAMVRVGPDLVGWRLCHGSCAWYCVDGRAVCARCLVGSCLVRCCLTCHGRPFVRP